MGKKCLPSVITALTVKFSTLEKIVQLVPVERSVFGKTTEGYTVFDVVLGLNGSLTVSSSIELEKVNELMKDSVQLYSQLDDNTCRHIHMAFEESDRFKQFLYFFLFIERYTHSQFKAIELEPNVARVINTPNRIKKTGVHFFKERLSNAKSLSERFSWCSIVAWNQVNDQDIECFKELKRVRDRISHGEVIDEMNLPIEKIRRLALKLLGTTTNLKPE